MLTSSMNVYNPDTDEPNEYHVFLLLLSRCSRQHRHVPHLLLLLQLRRVHQVRPQRRPRLRRLLRQLRDQRRLLPSFLTPLFSVPPCSRTLRTPLRSRSAALATVPMASAASMYPCVASTPSRGISIKGKGAMLSICAHLQCMYGRLNCAVGIDNHNAMCDFHGDMHNQGGRGIFMGILCGKKRGSIASVPTFRLMYPPGQPHISTCGGLLLLNLARRKPSQ